jgi:ribosomal protein S18 acetylase RimI-like enzyme
MEITIEKAAAVTPEIVAAFANLLPQLTDGTVPPDAQGLLSIVSQTGTTLFLARDSTAQILGTATLLCFRIPSGSRARIESLVVDRDARGRGVGRSLCEAALDEARRAGVDSIDLTSSHERKAANALYQRMGFRLRATNTYRFVVPRAEGEALSNPALQADDHLGRYAPPVARR